MRYLDHAATTPVRREVLEAMWPYLTNEFGNPSSHHEVGERAASALADARAEVAAALRARPAEVILTSGGTEGDNLVVKGIALANPRGRHLVTTEIEHEAVLESAEYLRRFHGFEMSFVPLTVDGLVTPEALRSVVRNGTTLVSIHHANNEIGVVQPVAALAGVAHELGVPFHADAVQSAPWLSLGLDEVDAITIAGHKLGAPKGIGAVAVRAGIPLEPLLHGGGQERGRRSGTENVAGAVGLATALRLTEQTRAAAERTAGIRDLLIDGVLAEVADARLTGPRTERLPGHASFCFPGTSGEAVLLELERGGIVSSSGSACAAGSDEPSHVLTALGFAPEIAQTAVRFTFAEDFTADDARATVAAVRDAVARVRGLGHHAG